LDYQGITFKGNDRKAMAVKAMVSEIEGLHKTKKLKQTQKNVLTKSHYQFMYEFPDKDVFKDATRVVYSYIDRQAGFNNHDREKVRTFIRSFIPLCFNVGNVEPEGVSHYLDDNDDDEMMDDDDDAQSTNTEDSESDAARSPSSAKRSTSPSPRRSRRGRNQEDDHTMDLLRDVLTKNKVALDEMGPVNVRDTLPASTTSESADDVDIPVKTESPPESLHQQQQSVKQEPASQVEEASSPSHNEKLLAAAAMATAPELRKRQVYSFFCNTTFYAFFRLFEVSMLSCLLLI
jgi:paired amphipathic helix protein Sin3a